MVKNGETASIDVGNEIPTISSKERSTENSGAPVISTVKYRKTGIRLTITPIIHSSGYVEININQELSEASLNVTSSIDSPTIFNRSLETTVTLKDGGSVLLGGLISESRSKGNSGIPVLGNLPLLGRIFSTDTKSTGRTELVLMVVPYIIDNPEDAKTISDSALEFYEMSL
jgi:general secretion pathway protein D